MIDVLSMINIINGYRQNARNDSAVANAADKQLRNNLEEKLFVLEFKRQMREFFCYFMLFSSTHKK